MKGMHLSKNASHRSSEHVHKPGRYGLGFISDEAIFAHVKETVRHYRTSIDLKDFNHNIVDPIKLTFDSKIYGREFNQIIDEECIRQIDKTNSNHIGYFHQNLFKYAGNGWVVPASGFDVINDDRHIFAEVKNKHNTMNAASSQRTYMKMQAKILSDSKATCMLVEVIAKKSRNAPWEIQLNGQPYAHEKIRRLSMDRFYGIVFGDSSAFVKLCRVLPAILDDVIEETHCGKIQNTVYDELRELSPDIARSIYLLAFKTYEGFGNF